MKYVYPAVLKKDDDGYFISFPDLQNCFTEGEDLSDAIAMAEDVLCLTLYNMEITGESIPEPSDIKEIQPKENETITLICCDTMEYRTYYNRQSSKENCIYTRMDERRGNSKRDKLFCFAPGIHSREIGI